MILRPQDLLLVLKFAALSHEKIVAHLPTLAKTIGLSLTETHMALKRAAAAKLLVLNDTVSKVPVRGRAPKTVAVHRQALLEFVQFGVPYVFVPERGRLTRGLVTGSSAPAVQKELGLEKAAIPSVWPDPRGEVRGESFSPLYPSAVTAAWNDAKLYKLLVLVDIIRGGTARERELGRGLFSKMLLE